jgi:GntR family transcriptional regulator
MPPTDTTATPQFSPLYSQIKALILQSMQQGEWKPGDLMPSELELAQRYAVSQGTVRKAIDELASSNQVVRRQGKGTFVASHTEHQAQYRFLRLKPDAPAEGSDGAAQRQVLVCERSRASASVARALKLRAQDPVVHARRLLSFAGVPTIVEDVWLPGVLFKGLSAEQLLHHPGSTYGLYESQFNVRMLRADEKIKAVAAPAELAELLRVAAGSPLLWVERVAYTYQDAPVELRHAWYLTDAHHYQNELL